MYSMVLCVPTPGCLGGAHADPAQTRTLQPYPHVCLYMQASALGVLQGPLDATVTVETAPLLDIPRCCADATNHCEAPAARYRCAR